MTPGELGRVNPNAALVADAGWSVLQNRILMGLCHDLNGRVQSLQEVTNMAAMGEPAPASFGTEVERLARVSRRLARLVGDVEAGPIPLALDELAEVAVDVLSRVKDREGPPVSVDTAPGLPAVLVNEARSLRLLLLFLERASHDQGEGATVELRRERDGAALQWHALGDGPDPDWIAALDRVAAADGGKVSVEAGVCELWIPSLAQRRAAMR